MNAPASHACCSALLMAFLAVGTQVHDGAASASSSASAARELRLAEQTAQLSARLERMEALGLSESLAAALDAIAKAPTDSQYTLVKDGWLYFRPLKFARFIEGPPPGETPEAGSYYVPGGYQLATIRDLQRQLADHDIELLVVPIPTRLDVYPELIVDRELGDDFAGYAPGLTRFLIELEQHGVEVVDLLPALARERVGITAPDDEQVFLRANGHWSPKGVVISARAIAERIRQSDWYAEYDAREPPEPERFEKAWSYRTQRLAEGAEPPVLQFERVVSGRGRMVDYRGDSPVLVMGDSFVWLYSVEGADLARQIQRFSGLPMDVISIPGGGAQACRTALARRRGGPKDKRMVIWLWAAECLMMVDSKWEPVDVFAR